MRRVGAFVSCTEGLHNLVHEVGNIIARGVSALRYSLAFMSTVDLPVQGESELVSY